MSSPKESVFPETIPEEASSIEEERVVIFRIPPSTFKPSVYTADTSLFQQSQEHIVSADEEQKPEAKFDFDKIHHYAERVKISFNLLHP